MHIEATKTFTKLYKKLPVEIKEQTKKVLKLFAKDSEHPSLGHKKIAGQDAIYELRVSDSYRITYQKSGDIIYLRKIGTHDLFRNP